MVSHVFILLHKQSLHHVHQAGISILNLPYVFNSQLDLSLAPAANTGMEIVAVIHSQGFILVPQDILGMVWSVCHILFKLTVILDTTTMEEDV